MSSTNRNSNTRRADDAYYTPAWCVRALLRTVKLPGGWWFEPAVGTGAIVRAVNDMRQDVQWTIADIVDRLPNPENVPFGYEPGACVFGTTYTANGFGWDRGEDVVITNPPYSRALDFVKGAMKDGKIVVMLLRLNWLASKARNRFLLDNPPSVYVLPKRPCFTGDGKTDSCEYAWFVWGLHDRPECRVISMEDCEADLSVALARGK
jgi:hypothetical protein